MPRAQRVRDVDLAVERGLQRGVHPALRHPLEVGLAQRHVDDVPALVAGHSFDLAGQPEAGQHARARRHRCPGSRRSARRPSGVAPKVPKALAHNSTAGALELVGIIAGDEHLDLSAAARAWPRGRPRPRRRLRRRPTRTSAAMPSFNCAAVSCAVGSTSTRTTAVLMPASLSAGQEGPNMNTSAITPADRAGGRRLAGDRAATAAVDSRRRGLRRVRRRRRLPAARRARRDCSTRSTAVGCWAAVARRSRSPSSSARCATPAGPVRHTVVLANGEEGEPASSRTGGCCATVRTWCSTGCGWPPASSAPTAPCVYVSDPSAAPALSTWPWRRDRSTACRSRVVTVDAGYVAGEETAAVRAVNGGPAKPTDKPPRPFEQGVDGQPTLVSNVETLANLPFVLRHGGADAFRAVGHVRHRLERSWPR